MTFNLESSTATHVPDPVDTTNPATICVRLGLIEDRIAFVSNELSRAAFWRKRYASEIELLGQALYAKTEGTIPERKAQITTLLAGDQHQYPQKLAMAEATYARFNTEMEGLDTRRSILQSVLKTHLREQEPRFGQGSHNRA